LANTLISDPVGRIYDALKIQLEKQRIDLKAAQAYTFDFGPKELGNMVGLSRDEEDTVLKNLLKARHVQVVDGKLHTIDVTDIVRQVEFYQKMERIERNRKTSLVRG
jgi:hypothetical protein